MESLTTYWNQLLSSGDVRSNAYPFIKDPTVVICSGIAYLLMVKYGPKFMANRNPLEIRKTMIAYNFFSVVFSLWMMWEFFACSFLAPGFHLVCEDVHESDVSVTSLRLVRAHWFYFFSKFIEFLDTLFFVVRKKNNQISFLHVYHHVSMLCLQWTLVKYVPGGVAYCGPLANCFIHAVMYLYYMLSAFGPHMQPYLWWKRYLTRMQMLQFVIVVVHNSFAIYCVEVFPVGLMWLQWWYLITLFVLFMNYYVKQYKQKTK